MEGEGEGEREEEATLQRLLTHAGPGKVSPLIRWAHGQRRLRVILLLSIAARRGGGGGDGGCRGVDPPEVPDWRIGFLGRTLTQKQ